MMEQTRSVREVLDHHLEASIAGDPEQVLADYAETAVMITRHGVYRGRQQITACFTSLGEILPNPRYTFTTQIMEGDVVFLEWTADSDKYTVSDGADTFVICDGYIQAQTIHYTPVAK